MEGVLRSDEIARSAGDLFDQVQQPLARLVAYLGTSMEQIHMGDLWERLADRRDGQRTKGLIATKRDCLSRPKNEDRPLVERS